MWVSDGSSELSVNGDRVTCNVDESSGGNVYNALWKEKEGDEGLQSGKSYWKLKLKDLKEGHLFVGVTDLKLFKQGWEAKGLLYGGNLSNGGCLLVGNFGPWLKNNDDVGIFVEIDENKIRVYFDVNGRCLGLAFEVPKSTLGPGIFPLVHFSGNGSVSIQKSEDYPSTSREEEKFEGFLGHWKYSSGSFETGDADPTFDIRGTTNVHKGSLKVINSISVSITREGPQGVFKGQIGATTLMGGSPEMMRLESEMSHHVGSGSFTLNEATGQMVINDGDKTSTWTRFTPTKSPVTDNPFQ